MKKKRNISRFLFLAIVLVVIISTSTCEVALGSAINVLPPTVKADTLGSSDGIPVRGTFTVSGTAKDDDGIASVKINFVKRGEKKPLKSYTAVLEKPGMTKTKWSVKIDNTSTGFVKNTEELVKEYPIPDGEYNVIISVTDKGNRTESITKVYNIDNTPPVLIIDSPTSIAGPKKWAKGSADIFGSKLKIKGQIGDANTVKYIELIGYSSEKNVKSENKVSKVSIKKTLAGSRSVDLIFAEAKLTNNSYEDNFYGKLLELQGDTNHTGKDKDSTHNIISDFLVEDNARIVSLNNTGNQSEFFYLMDDLRTVMDKNNYTVQTIYNYFSGREKTLDPKMIELLKTKKIQCGTPNFSDKNSDTNKKVVIKLKPNKDPGYNLNNFAFKTLATADSQKLYMGMTINIDLKRNRDHTQIMNFDNFEESQSKTELKVYLVRRAGFSSDSDFKAALNSNPKNISDESKFIKIFDINDSKFKKNDPSDSNFKKAKIERGFGGEGNATLSIKLPTSYDEGKYALLLLGLDYAGNKYQPISSEGQAPNENEWIIFKLAQLGNEIVFYPPSFNGYYTSKRKLNVKVKVLNFGQGDVYYKIDGVATKADNKLSFVTGSDGEYAKKDIDVSKLSNGEHKIFFYCRNGVGKSYQDNDDSAVTFKVDNDKPSFTITNFPNPASNWIKDNTIVLEGSASDTTSGSEKIEYKFSKSGPVEGLATVGKNGKWKRTISLKEGANKIIFTCYDKAGNPSNEQEKTINVDTTLPKRPKIKKIDGNDAQSPLSVTKKDITIICSASASDSGSGSDLASDLKGIKWVLEGSVGEVNTPDSNDDWKITIPKAKVTGGIVYITAVDNAGNESGPALITFLLDDAAPTVKITNFADANQSAPDNQTGEISIKGSIVDEKSSGVNKDGTKWKTVEKTADEPTATDSDWNDMTSSTAGSWTIEDLNLAHYFTGGTAGTPYTSSYATETSSGSGIFTLPIYIRVEDNAGNTGVEKLLIQVDPAGDRPSVEVLAPACLKTDNPETDATSVGGKVSVYGTATVNKGSVGKVFIQVSTDPDFNSFISGYEDEGKEVTGTRNWNIVLNAGGEIDTKMTNNNLDELVVYYRLYAKNGNAAHAKGSYTKTYMLKFDKGNPVIEDATLYKENTEVSNYKMNSWIGEDNYLHLTLKDGSGIKNISFSGDISKDLEGNVAITAYEIKSGEKVFTQSTAHGTYYDYTAKIPLIVPSNSGGTYSFSITVTEGTKTGSKFLTRTETFTFQYDTIDPKGVLGMPLAKGNSDFDGSKTVPANISDAKAGMYLFVDGEEIAISDVSGTLSMSKAFTGEKDWVLYDDADYLRGSATWNGLAYDEGGSEVNKVKIRLYDSTDTIVKFDSSTNKYSDTDSDTEMIIEGVDRIKQKIGNIKAWDMPVDVSDLDDGIYKVKFIVEDTRGNSSDEVTKTVYIKNNPIQIAKVLLGTDLDLSGTIENDEFVTYPSSNEVKDEHTLDYSAEINATNFTFKNADLANIKLECTGGNGGVEYSLKKADNSVLVESDGSGGFVSVDKLALPSNKTIVLGAESIAKLGSGTVVLDLVLTDSKGWTSSEKITVKVDTSDTVKPFASVLPLYWNEIGSDKNSVIWDGDTAKGHISYEGYATEFDADGNITEWSGRPAVSGKIKIEGYAYDERVLKSLTVQAANLTALSTFEKDSENNWAVDGAETSDGMQLTVKTIRLDQTGHYVYWTLEWDTEKISNSMGKNIEVSASAKDMASPDTGADSRTKSCTKETIADTNAIRNGETKLTLLTDDEKIQPGQTICIYKAGYSDDDAYYTQIDSKDGQELTLKNSVDTELKNYTVYATGEGFGESSVSLTVDVMPYVTALKRDSKYNTHRSKSGAYNVLRGDELTVSGFNLLDSAKIVIPGTGTEVSLDSEKKFTLPLDAKSGNVLITKEIGADTFESINNKTNNSKPYNSQKQAGKSETKYWTDDLAIDVWKDNDVFKGPTGLVNMYNPMYPAMAMGNKGALFASFSNYSKSDVYYSKLGDTKATQVFHMYDPPEETAICVSGEATVNVAYSANYHNGGQKDWTSDIEKAGGLYCYDQEANYFSKDATSTGNYLKGKIHRFELFYHNKQLQQFKNFRIARGDNDRIHIAYYDILTNSIKYSTVLNNAKGNRKHENLWINIDGSYERDMISESIFSKATILQENKKTAITGVVNTDVSLDLVEDIPAQYDFNDCFIMLSGDTDSATPINVQYGPYRIKAKANKNITFTTQYTSWDKINGYRYYKLVYFKTPILENSQFASGLDRISATAEYCAIALDNANKPVVVYGDVDSGALRLARCSSDNSVASDNWKVQTVLSSSDANNGLVSDYFSAKFDGEGFLHIAFRNTRGQLCYVKSTNKASEVNAATAYTFGASEIIDDFGTWADLTIASDNNPYISYMSKANSYDGIKVAYQDADFVKSWDANGNPNEKGAWNIMTAAMQNRAKDGRSCIAVHPTPVTATWKIAVGYKPGKTYNAVKYIGK